MSGKSIKVKNIRTASGKKYAINVLMPGEYQYLDRLYQFNYVPDELIGCTHIKTCGDDKLISENKFCFSFEIDEPATVGIIFADKFPVIPNWLRGFEASRHKITRTDSMPSNLKGYFTVFYKKFPKGIVEINGCSPESMLTEEFISTGGSGYCMYTVVVC
ncbi:MAG TPA: hypothetical protein DCZ94_06620 [Lentisphaeria bacterium]|nr:MAG: hypothetical protein A2X48_10760 [Lentisphaerae bacterium GWF2_49_21]HBC86609.1 hypothetical protein [Lentisphaeria bacterium]